MKTRNDNFRTDEAIAKDIETMEVRLEALKDHAKKSYPWMSEAERGEYAVAELLHEECWAKQNR